MKKVMVILTALVFLVSACAGLDIAGKAYAGETDQYAPPYDVFNNNAQIVFVELIEVSEDSLQYKVNVDHPSSVVLGKGHYYTNDWKEFQFNKQGTVGADGNTWVESPAQATLTLSRKEVPSGIGGVIVQSCKNQGGNLLCGCKSATDCGYWMFQSPTKGGACIANDECHEGDVCIDNRCGKLAELYEPQECPNKCQLQSAVMVTGEGGEHIVGIGGGSYTAAEALFWSIEGGPAHCPTQETRVPVRIVKKNYGENIGEEYLTLKKGETSKTIYHPTSPTVAFTLRVNDVKVDCY